MALTDKELRMLEQMERALVEEDPKLASTLRGSALERSGRTRAALAGIAFLGGIGLLLGGVIWRSPVVGILGFVVMLGSAAIALAALRATPPLADSQASGRTAETPRPGPGPGPGRRPGFGSAQSPGAARPGKPARRPRGSAHPGSMMERLEQRWRQRRERGR